MLKTEVQKKSERIAAAAYLITGFFDDKEPLKWKLRTLSSELVSRPLYQKDITVILKEMGALFSVAKSAGLVSDMNHGILQGEIEKLLGSDVADPLAALFASRLEEPKIQEEPRRLEEREAPRAEREIKDKTSVALIAEPREEKPLKEFGAVAVKKNSRQSVIIGLLKRKKEIMVKDVSPLIEGVSEKTIQRELLAMVEEGILRKIGEKRWSRYSLAN